VFYRIYAELKKHYHVIMFDLLGMGRSSRPKFNCRTPEESENFFVVSFEKWREKMGLGNMVILAHSFGGYISGKYALRFPQHVKKIIFISSLGIDKAPEDSKAQVRKLMDKQHWTSRVVFKIYRMLPFKLTPFMPLRAMGRFTSPVFVKFFMKKRMAGIPKEHFNTAYKYLYQIFLRSGSGEYALHKMFDNGIIPYSPIIDSLEDFKQNNITVSFIYGDSDWMNTDFNGNLS